MCIIIIKVAYCAGIIRLVANNSYDPLVFCMAKRNHFSWPFEQEGNMAAHFLVTTAWKPAKINIGGIKLLAWDRWNL